MHVDRVGRVHLGPARPPEPPSHAHNSGWKAPLRCIACTWALPESIMRAFALVSAVHAAVLRVDPADARPDIATAVDDTGSGDTLQLGSHTERTLFGLALNSTGEVVLSMSTRTDVGASDGVFEGSEEGFNHCGDGTRDGGALHLYGTASVRLTHAAFRPPSPTPRFPAPERV